MKRDFINITLFAMLVFVGGCSAGTDYWASRLDDGKDIFTATVGMGFGAKVQAGPIQIDSGYNYSPLAGLHGGELFVRRGMDNEWFHVEEGNIGVFLPFANTEIFYPGAHAVERGKAYAAFTPLLPVFIIQQPEKGSCNSCSFRLKMAVRRAAQAKIAEAEAQGIELKSINNTYAGYLSREEYELIRNAPECGGSYQLYTRGKTAWNMYSDINVSGSLILGFRFGINPGELLDFFIGFGGLDLYGDDL